MNEFLQQFFFRFSFPSPLPFLQLFFAILTPRMYKSILHPHSSLPPSLPSSLPSYLGHSTPLFPLPLQQQRGRRRRQPTGLERQIHCRRFPISRRQASRPHPS